jgi:nucleoside-diphosphate-sugar epimerase
MMSKERFLVTGAMGCIGSWIVRNLVQEEISTTVFDLSDQPHRMKLIMSDEEIRQVNFVKGDITDVAQVKQAIQEHHITHIIHLAALQVPFCRADPVLGAQANVVGTVSVFEAARAAGIQHIVFASSAAVYGIEEEYPTGLVSHDAPLKPRTLYGVYKQANEGTARVYWLDHGINSIGLRPYVVYGAGRDQGMTSTPTKAMLAAVLGQSYYISFGGRFNMQYADDVARIFIQSARSAFVGADVFNLRGSTLHMQDVVAAICAAKPQMTGKLSYEEKGLAFPPDLDDMPLVEAIGTFPNTPLIDGVTMTIGILEHAVAAGLLSAEHLK